MPHCEQSGSGQVGTCTRLAGSTSTHRLSGLTVFSRPDSDGTVVHVCGELDLATDQQLLQALRSDPSGADGRVQLDLSGVEFCDCSAVNILLRIRQRTLGPVDQPAPAPELGDASSPGASPPPSADRDLERDPDADLRLELGQLRRAMESRGTIDLARGILMAAFALTPDDAWRVLVATSQHTNTKLRCLAEQVVVSTRGTPLPEPVRKHLSAAVAETAAPPRQGSGDSGSRSG
ncbi:ANTAR domain-containing protein [Streptomyces sp. NPDC001415]